MAFSDQFQLNILARVVNLMLIILHSNCSIHRRLLLKCCCCEEMSNRLWWCLVVSMVILYSDGVSSNRTEVYSFNSLILFERTKQTKQGQDWDQSYKDFTA